MKVKVNFDSENCPLHLLHRASQCAEDLFHLATYGLNITPRQFMVLTHVGKRQGLSQTDLVQLVSG